MSPMRCRLWPLWLLMTCGAGAGARTSSDDAPSSDDVLTDQLSCMADYLRVTHRHRVDVFVNVTITERQLSGLLLLLSGRRLFARLWRGSPVSALQEDEEPEEASSDLSDQAVWLVPDTDSDATDALLARVRRDGRRRWLLASLSGRRRGQFLGGFAQLHTYMTFHNGTTWFHRARDFHQRRPRAKGVCRGGEYQKWRQQALSRRVMEGVHLRVLYADADQNLGAQALQTLHRDGVITGGLIGSLILVLQEVLGFTYSLHEVNGTKDLTPWDHITQLLHQGHGDLFGGLLIISPSRKQLVDFSFPLFYELAGAVIDSRYMLTLTEFQITQPLQRSVWCALLVTQLLAVLVLCLIARCQQQIRRATGEPCDALDVSLWALLVLGVSCQQGAAVRSDAAASYRLAIAALYLMSLFIAACYSGNLLAEMTLARRVMPFSSLQQALEQGWQVTDAGLTLAVRETILQPLMGRDIDQLPMVSEGPLEGRVIQMSDVVFAEHNYNCSHLGRGDVCPVCIWPGSVTREPLPLAFRRNFPYLSMFNDVLLQLRDQGIIDRLRRRWSSQRAGRDMLCQAGTVAPLGMNPLGISNLRNMVAIVGFGILGSGVVLLLECSMWLLWLWYDKKKNYEVVEIEGK